ncbi:MAG: glycosyltransferase family 39 protein [Planctomycetaceae bacterium]|nr:glycosyltransferase family 39 protein [Planctomycetaceae bacterium]
MMAIETQSIAPVGAGVRLRAIALLAAILAFCAVERIWLIGHSQIVEPDGVVYISAAQEWHRGPIHMMQLYDIHPAYPAMVAYTQSLLDVAGAREGPDRWILAGQIVSLAASLAALVGVWCFARLAMGEDVAWITVLLFGLGRKWAELGAGVLTDAPALALMLWAVLAALTTLRLMQQRRPAAWLAAGAAGLAAAAAYLVRPEGLMVFAAAGALWLVAAACRRVTWRAAMTAIAIAVVVMAACAAPYAVTIGTITKRWDVARYLHLASIGGTAAAWPLAAADMSTPGKIFQVLPKLTECMHPLLAGLACLWIAAALARRYLPHWPRQIVPAAMSWPGGAMILIWTAILLPVVIVRNLSAPMSSRYMLLDAALLAPLAGAGALVLAQGVGEILGRLRAKAARKTAVIGVAVVLAGALAAHAARPLHAGDECFRQAGRWLGANARRDAFALVPTAQILIYSQISGEVYHLDSLPAPQALREELQTLSRKYSAVYLVASPQALEAMFPAPAEAPRLTPGQTFVSLGKKQQSVQIFRYAPGAATQPAHVIPQS